MKSPWLLCNEAWLQGIEGQELSKILFTISPKSCSGPNLFKVNVNIPKISSINTELFHKFVTKKLFVRKCEGYPTSYCISYWFKHGQIMCYLNNTHDNVLPLNIPMNWITLLGILMVPVLLVVIRNVTCCEQ